LRAVKPCGKITATGMKKKNIKKKPTKKKTGGIEYMISPIEKKEKERQNNNFAANKEFEDNSPY